MKQKLEKEDYRFFPTDILNKTEDIEKRCNTDWIECGLQTRYPKDKIKVSSVKINTSGMHKASGDSFNKIFGISKTVTGLPDLCEVRVEYRTGKFTEKIVVWSPFSWNDRFAGTVGGGCSTGGEGYLTAPDNTTRGWTVPYAVMNGFTAATADAGNVNGMHDYMTDSKTGKVQKELYENWRIRTTHHMTIIGKAVAEILHERPVKYSYINGGSGGGRQVLMEAQEYPEDYDGIWASCPAINWTKFIFGGLWAIAVMNTENYILSPEKIQYFTECVWEAAGGKKAYFSSEKKVLFNPRSLVGKKTKKGTITSRDAKIMDQIWNGPTDFKGKKLWYGFRPGVTFWNVGLPVGAFYYSLIRKKPKPFFLSSMYARWVTENPKQKFDKITVEEFEMLFTESMTKFKNACGDNGNLKEFANHGGKLMIDHGLNDPLVPVDGTIDYYKKILKEMGKKHTESFCRLYLTPGDGHGNCWSEEPGITERAGMEALMHWVENGKAPEELRCVKVNRKTGELIEEGKRCPVKNIEDWT